MNITPTRLYLALVRRLHFLVLLAMIVPCYCLIVTYGLSDAEAGIACSHLLPLYALTLTLSLPASFMYLLQEKIRGLGTYLLCVLPVCFLFLWALCSLEMETGLSIRGGEQVPQFLILLIYLFDAIRMRTNDNSRRKAKAQEDLSWTGDAYLLPLPALPILLPFAVIYVGALFLHSDEIAQIALTGAILYFFLVLPYLALYRKEDFLESRHHISRIPARQIARLQGAALFRLLIPCVLIAAAAIMTSGGRQFLDAPELHLEYGNTNPYGGFYEENALLRELTALGLIEQGTPPPQWLIHLLDFLENVLTVFMTAVLAWFIWLIVRSIYQRFRKFNGEEDPSSSVGESRDEHTSLSRKPAKVPASPEDRSIRRRYRRTILRYRGHPPAPGETPAMMERLAGLPDTPEMRALHEDYELARYARSKDSARQSPPDDRLL